MPLTTGLSGFGPDGLSAGDDGNSIDFAGAQCDSRLCDIKRTTTVGQNRTLPFPLAYRRDKAWHPVAIGIERLFRRC